MCVCIYIYIYIYISRNNSIFQSLLQTDKSNMFPPSVFYSIVWSYCLYIFIYIFIFQDAFERVLEVEIRIPWKNSEYRGKSADGWRDQQTL